jgi:hypothetical protein
MQPYNTVKRTGTEKGSSVIYPPELIQEGLAVSKIATAYSFIPCDIPTPKNVIITPVLLSGTSENGIALFTTVVGWYVDSLTTLKAVTDLDAHEASVAYQVGNIVKATRTGSTEKAYICIAAHSSASGPDFDADYALDYWLEIATTTFLKIVHTSAGSAKVAQFAYAILGQ